MLEIERKFLVSGTAYRTAAQRQTEIRQGFLNTDPERTVRVRLRDGVGTLTVKGKSSEDGLSRFEWETEIPEAEAKALLQLSETLVLEKIRYEVRIGPHTYEVDEFSGANAGLVIAEIELGETDEDFEKPAWLGREVTGDPRYYNSQLSIKPYTQWNES